MVICPLRRVDAARAPRAIIGSPPTPDVRAQCPLREIGTFSTACFFTGFRTVPQFPNQRHRECGNSRTWFVCSPLIPCSLVCATSVTMGNVGEDLSTVVCFVVQYSFTFRKKGLTAQWLFRGSRRNTWSLQEHVLPCCAHQLRSKQLFGHKQLTKQSTRPQTHVCDSGARKHNTCMWVPVTKG